MPIHKGVEVLALPPPGYEVDFDNPQREAVPVPYYVAAFGVALTLVFMAQRVFVKLRISGGLQVDDCEYSPPFPWLSRKRTCELIVWDFLCSDLLILAWVCFLYSNNTRKVHCWEKGY